MATRVEFIEDVAYGSSDPIIGHVSSINGASADESTSKKKPKGKDNCEWATWNDSQRRKAMLAMQAIAMIRVWGYFFW